MSEDMTRWEQRRSSEGARPHRHKDDRNPYERDRARIVHSAAFRRLQAKTQVLGINEGDFRRTRLTHSMEVAQIAVGIATRFRTDPAHEGYREWLPSRELVEAVCFAHDLGHPPFGHGGERVPNNALLTSPSWPKGEAPVGFEGNGQTLRLLSLLEAQTEGHGLDLTRRTLLGVLKYRVAFSRLVRTGRSDTPPSLLAVRWADWKPPKCYLDTEAACVEWLLSELTEKDRARFAEFTVPNADKHGKPAYKSLDCSIMDVADEIAYGVHDFEDGVALRLIPRADWDAEVRPQINPRSADAVGLKADELGDQLFADGPGKAAGRKLAVGGLANALLSSVELEEDTAFCHPLLRLNARMKPEAKALRDALQRVVERRMIFMPGGQTLEYRGQVNLLALFRAVEADPEGLIGSEFRQRLDNPAFGGRLRVVADYVSGMTDEYATRMFERLSVPRHGTVFDRL